MLTGMVRRYIGFRTAGRLLVGAFSLLAVFHCIVLAGIVPPEIVWGGDAAELTGDLFRLEMTALGATFIFMFVIAVRTGLVGIRAFPHVFAAGAWFVFAYLILNTAGNFMAGALAEKLIFTPFAIVLSVLAFRVAVGDVTGVGR
jgi:hypothetical protein